MPNKRVHDKLLHGDTFAFRFAPSSLLQDCADRLVVGRVHGACPAQAVPPVIILLAITPVGLQMASLGRSIPRTDTSEAGRSHKERLDAGTPGWPRDSHRS